MSTAALRLTVLAGVSALALAYFAYRLVVIGLKGLDRAAVERILGA